MSWRQVIFKCMVYSFFVKPVFNAKKRIRPKNVHGANGFGNISETLSAIFQGLREEFYVRKVFAFKLFVSSIWFNLVLHALIGPQK